MDTIHKHMSRLYLVNRTVNLKKHRVLLIASCYFPSQRDRDGDLRYEQSTARLRTLTVLIPLHSIPLTQSRTKLQSLLVIIKNDTVAGVKGPERVSHSAKGSTLAGPEPPSNPKVGRLIHWSTALCDLPEHGPCRASALFTSVLNTARTCIGPRSRTAAM